MSSWYSVADHIGNKCCFERQRLGSCGCRARGKRGKNPCGLAARLKAACEALDSGLPTDVTLDEIHEWLRKHTCYASQRGELCNHRGCDTGERLMAWVAERISDRKAA